MEQDKPNSRSNRRLRGILTDIAMAILRNCKHTARQDDLCRYARVLKDQNMPKKRRVYKVAAKVGRILFHLLHTGETYDSGAEQARLRGRAKTTQNRSRQARRQQAYRKARDARLVAERTAGMLLALLEERGLEAEAQAAITAASERVEAVAASAGAAQGEAGGKLGGERRD